MSNHLEMTDEQRSVLGKVEKLLRLAGSNPNQEEAAAAAKKAQDLLLAYNLDAAALGGSDADGKRSEEKLQGGFYKFERDLWYAISEINFCLYWTSSDWIERPEKDRKRKKVQERYSDFAQMYRKQTRHHLVGRKVAVMSTKFMADYLLSTIDRLTYDFISQGLPRNMEGKVVGLSGGLRSRRATSFREGVAEVVAGKLWDRRNDQIAEERKKAREERERFEASGASSSTAVSISSVRQSERDANMDAIYGEGYSARTAAAAAERARALKEAEQAYTAWAAAHPEEAKAEEEKRRKEEKKRSSRSTGRGSRGGKVDKDYDSGAYWAGRAAGKDVGIDPQAEHSSAPKKIGRS